MPWIFSVCKPNPNQGAASFALRVARDYTVGRQAARIKVLDKAVSRQHAILTVCASPELSRDALAPTQQLWLRDVSRFGTHVNGQRISAAEPVRLSDNDRVTLGENGCACRVHWQPMRVALSGASAAVAERVSALLLDCGAVLVSSEFEWLVTQEVGALSQKLLFALVAGVPVVQLAWLEQLIADARAAVDAEPALPDAALFAPVLASAEMRRWRDVDGMSLAPLPERAALFRRTLFFFLEQGDFDVLAAVVERGGGHALRFDLAAARPSVAAALREHIAGNLKLDEHHECSSIVFVTSDAQPAPHADVQLVAAERGALVAPRSLLLQALLTGKPMAASRSAARLEPPSALSVVASRDASVVAAKRARPAVVVGDRKAAAAADDDSDEDGWLSRSTAQSEKRPAADSSKDAAAAAVVDERAAVVALANAVHDDDAQLVVRAVTPALNKKFRKMAAPSSAEPRKVVSSFAEAQAEAERPEFEQLIRDRNLEDRDEARYTKAANDLFAAAASGVKRKR